MLHFKVECGTSSNEAYNIISQFAIKLFHEFAGLVAIFNASHNLLEIVTIWGSPQSTDAFTPDECLALRRGQTYNVKDPKDTLICPHITIPDNKEPLPYICVPMMAQGEILGVLYLQDDPQYKESHSKPETKERLAKNVAEHLALAIATLKLREKLRDQSIRDPLTGLFNRRYMEETLGRELRRAIRNKSSFGIIMVDIDYFKRFNDTFGHEAGDMVLRTIGDFLKSHIRGSDIACRYGGEEFAIILADASQEETQKRAEGLREGVKRMHLQFHGQLLGSISISLGVAIYPLHGITENELLRIADDALYLAKKEGRDRVIIGEISGG
ncbi:MAG: sensor domain-containing diguanylate cyclase [Nitrospinota bacterium]